MSLFKWIFLSCHDNVEVRGSGAPWLCSADRHLRVDRVANTATPTRYGLTLCGSILNKIKDISSKHLFNTMNWMPFYDRIIYKRCLVTYKVNNNLVPQYLQSVTPITSVHTHNTRSAARGALYTCTANLNYFTRCLKYEVARLWNNLDIYIEFSPSIATFKQRCLKDYFTV